MRMKKRKKDACGHSQHVFVTLSGMRNDFASASMSVASVELARMGSKLRAETTCRTRSYGVMLLKEGRWWGTGAEDGSLQKATCVRLVGDWVVSMDSEEHGEQQRSACHRCDALSVGSVPNGSIRISLFSFPPFSTQPTHVYETDPPVPDCQRRVPDEGHRPPHTKIRKDTKECISELISFLMAKAALLKKRKIVVGCGSRNTRQFSAYILPSCVSIRLCGLVHGRNSMMSRIAMNRSHLLVHRSLIYACGYNGRLQHMGAYIAGRCIINFGVEFMAQVHICADDMGIQQG
ncbi:hypothetical protein C8R44DRAFT_744218 [Mycena epipterygia]|nr:hypothetical protein C8R44DRAFT_744218 [Mycena epipterygia]